MSQAIRLVVDDEGQILIPAGAQQRLGLSPGMVLVAEETDKGLRLRIRRDPDFVDEGGVLVVRGELDQDITDITRQERETRTADLLRRTDR